MTRILFTLALVLAACGPRDADGDGVPDAEDCDANNPDVSPDRPDTVGDGIDTNCDGIDGVDADGDGVASFASGGGDCADDDRLRLGDDLDNDGYLACLDCDDEDRLSYPGAEELCDGLDNSCDGTVDLDATGLGACEATRGAGQDLDVLFVVDNSTGMNDYQYELVLAAQAFRAELAANEVNYRIGVISTDYPSDQGRLHTSGGVKWLATDTQNPDQILGNMLQLGSSGAVQERGRDCAYKALADQGLPGSFNEGFLRPQAPLEVVFLSDEDDSSAMPIADLEDYLRSTFLLARVHTFVSTDATCSEPGLDYIDLADRFGGQVVDVCTGDFAGALSGVAAAYDGIVPTYLLDPDLDPATLTATVHTAVGGTVAEYGPTELVWDATTATATLPALVEPGQTVTFRYALVPAEVE